MCVYVYSGDEDMYRAIISNYEERQKVIMIQI